MRRAIRELHHIIPELSKTTIHEAVTEKLGYRKLCTRWVPQNVNCNAVMTWFKGQAADFYDSGIQNLVPRLGLRYYHPSLTQVSHGYKSLLQTAILIQTNPAHNHMPYFSNVKET
jgi:hypothetical protein